MSDPNVANNDKLPKTNIINTILEYPKKFTVWRERSSEREREKERESDRQEEVWV